MKRLWKWIKAYSLAIIHLETNKMAKVTLTNDDGSTVDFVDQATVDAAVAAAVTAATNPVTPEATEVDVVLTDGSVKKFVPQQ